MAAPIGTLMLSDLLVNQAGNQTVIEFGVDNMADLIRADLDAFNGIFREIVGEIAAPTVLRMENFGGAGSKHMYRAGEIARTPTQKVGAGYNVGYPLGKTQIAWGWDDEWFRRKRAVDAAKEVLANEAAHVRLAYAELQRSLFLSSNYSFVDEYEDPVLTLPVKRLANADGQQLPLGPSGQTFDGATHTHFLASATLDNAAATSLVNTVLEHRVTGDVRVVIAQADRADWEGLSNFKELADSRLVPTPGDVRQTADLTRSDDLQIGFYGAASVWVKPYGLADYPFAYDRGADPPLRFRERTGVGLQGLRIAARNDLFPLHAEWMEAFYGFGVRNRVGAAVLYIGGGSYVEPVLP